MAIQFLQKQISGILFPLILLSLLISGCENSTRDVNQPAEDQFPDLAAPLPITLPAIPGGSGAKRIYLKITSEISAHSQTRITQLLSQDDTIEVIPLELNAPISGLETNEYFISIGATPESVAVIDEQELQELGSEGFLVETQLMGQGKAFYIRGNNNNDKEIINNNPYSIGTYYGAYALLEAFGYNFLHPLEPTVPLELNINQTIMLRENPHWPIRAWHIHTQHPLELTHVLNGWGPKGPDDFAGWEALLTEWESFLEWSIANRQNRVEWVLLMAASWQEFADSAERQSRLQRLVDMAHEWSLAVGIDAPIAFAQQHSWLMLRDLNQPATEQIHQAIDWLHEAGFDYFEIEMGFSEFTHPTDHDMLEWMNTAAIYADETYGKRLYTKVHCTQDQLAKNYSDPVTGDALNFNFLPYYADERLGVLPHTVQYYDLEGPAYTYDNTNFNFIRRYMQLEGGRREVLFYPETAYWVSYDVDVPLFLPIYADRRLYDLRLIAEDEIEGRIGHGEYQGSRIDGQVNFSSGWEWGYWINDVVTARAAWDPLIHIEDHQKALSVALDPIVTPFNQQASEVKQILMDLITVQNDLFIFGGLENVDPTYKNAQAYLQGWESWDDVGHLLGQLETQPAKLGFSASTQPLLRKSGMPSYQEIAPMLQATWEALSDLNNRFQTIELGEGASPSEELLLAELQDALAITFYRSQQVYFLYETLAEQRKQFLKRDFSTANIYLNLARQSLDEAQYIAQRQEQRYRVDPDRVAGWNYNPTVYHYGYLWTVRSLHYWWRDEVKTIDNSLLPHHLNVIDPIDVANGEGTWRFDIINVNSLRSLLINLFGQESWVSELLTEPAVEPTYPIQDLRTKPKWYEQVY